MLSKQLIPLAFRQGLDTKRDKKQQLWGTLRQAQNVVFETLDSARKRNGYDALTLESTDGQVIASAEFLAKFKEELLVFDSTTLWGRSESLEKLENRGAIYSVFPTSFPTVNNSYNNAEVDMVQVSGLKVFAYHNTVLNTVQYSVQDSVSQTMLVTDQEVATNASRPRVVALGQRIFILYATGTNIAFKTFEIDNPANISTETISVSNLQTTSNNFDAMAVANRIILAYHSTNGLAELYITFINFNGVTGAPTQLAEDPNNAIDIKVDSSGYLVISWASATEVKYVIYTANLTSQLVAPTVVEAIANVYNVHACEVTAGEYDLYYTISSANSYDYFIKKAAIDLVNAPGTPAVFMRSVSLASKCFTIAGNVYLLVSYDSVAQATYFVVDTNGVIVSKISQGTAGGAIVGSLPKTHVADNTVVIPSCYKTKFVVDNGEFFSLSGITNTLVDFAVDSRYQNSALGNNLLIGGGVVQSYDGQQVVEQGFNVYPEPPVATAVTVAGVATNYPTRSMANSASLLDTYGYCIVYRWTDHQGQEHRSAPSEIVNIHLASLPTPEIAVSLAIPTLRLSQKTNVVVEVYRTELNGTIFYLANSLTPPFFNNSAVDTVTFIDGRPDDDLISGRLLYTTGGVLDNIAPPSARVLATHTASQRIFLAGLEDPNLLQYSKITNSNQAVEFNDALTIAVDPIGGSITALASMDEKLVIFEEDAIFFIGGTGPNNLGQQNSFTTPERISIDMGCTDPKSVILTPDGLMFKGRKGICLLDRALGLTYIGAPVEEFNALKISSAKVVGELNQVRFTTLDGDCLVYNYVYKFWATFTNHRAFSAEVVGNDYYYIRQNNALYKENRTSFSDAGSVIKMRLEIGWISFATLQGFSRVYKMLVLGDWYSPHNLLIQVAYDFKDVWVESATITPETAGITATAYGNNSPYGEPTGEPYGGTGEPYQTRINFKQQKCQSIKLLVEDVQENAGEGFSLSQITFQVGGKSGLFKMAKGKSFATS